MPQREKYHSQDTDILTTYVVVVWFQQGYCQQATAHQTGLLRFIRTVTRNYEESGHDVYRIIQWRIQKTVRILKVISLRDRNKSSQMLSWHLAESPGTKVNVRNRLTRNGLKGRVVGRQTRNKKTTQYIKKRGTDIGPEENLFRRTTFRRRFLICLYASQNR